MNVGGHVAKLEHKCIAGGIVKWSNHSGWQFGTMPKRALKDCLPFDPAIPLLGLYPKEVMGKTTCTKIFIATRFVVAKKLENEGMSFNLGNGWTNCGICWWSNTIVSKGIMNCRNSMWTGKTSRNWCRVKGAEPGEHYTQRLVHCGTIKHNVLLCQQPCKD